jgi:hypothetical protein
MKGETNRTTATGFRSQRVFRVAASTRAFVANNSRKGGGAIPSPTHPGLSSCLTENSQCRSGELATSSGQLC